MMTNLFSMFDPTMSLFSFSWTMILMVIFILPMQLWNNNTMNVILLNTKKMIKKEVLYTIPSSKKGLMIFMTSVFLTLVLFNFLALFPFTFCVTSHMLVTLPFSYSLWIGIIMFSWTKSFMNFLAHLVPNGTPIGLMSFMVLVEILSNFIRPLALTFRLTANMMAGHLLMSLVGGFLVNLPLIYTLSGGVIQSLLVTMELGVSLIQAYVFSTLLLLYISESA